MEASDFFDRLSRRDAIVVVDDEHAAGPASTLGFRVAAFDEHDFTQQSEEAALAIITRMGSIQRLHSLWGRAVAPFCHLSLAKFESSPRSLAYSLEHLLSLDHKSALRRREESYEKLFSCEGVEVTTAGGVLRFHVNDEVEVANCGATLEPGHLYSVFEFFEASIVNLEAERSSFWVEGDLAFDAMIYLCNDAELKLRYGKALDDLVRRASLGGNRLRFSDNALASVTIGGTDETAAFLEMLNQKEREGAATEFGLGCAELQAAEDRSLSAVLHKAKLGVYAGIGKGHHIPHIDFIAAPSAVRFVGES